MPSIHRAHLFVLADGVAHHLERRFHRIAFALELGEHHQRFPKVIAGLVRRRLRRHPRHRRRSASAHAASACGSHAPARRSAAALPSSLSLRAAWSSSRCLSGDLACESHRSFHLFVGDVVVVERRRDAAANRRSTRLSCALQLDDVLRWWSWPCPFHSVLSVSACLPVNPRVHRRAGFLLGLLGKNQRQGFAGDVETLRNGERIRICRHAHQRSLDQFLLEKTCAIPRRFSGSSACMLDRPEADRCCFENAGVDQAADLIDAIRGAGRRQLEMRAQRAALDANIFPCADGKIEDWCPNSAIGLRLKFSSLQPLAWMMSPMRSGVSSESTYSGRRSRRHESCASPRRRARSSQSDFAFGFLESPRQCNGR